MSTLTSSGWKIQHKSTGKGRRRTWASVKKVLPLYPVFYLESEHTCTLAQHCSWSPALQICNIHFPQSLLRPSNIPFSPSHSMHLGVLQDGVAEGRLLGRSMGCCGPCASTSLSPAAEGRETRKYLLLDHCGQSSLSSIR